MKKIFLLMGLALLFMSFRPQSDAQDIINAFKSANAESVAKYFDDYIDMKLLDRDEVKNMGRNQATIALKGFYAENGIKGFEKLSDREIANTMYMTGKLQTSGKGFNVTVMMKLKDGRHQITNIRIN
ncbi:MAG: hypothetical protein NVSMB63_08000 [Sediminibacterium sp.]